MVKGSVVTLVAIAVGAGLNELNDPDRKLTENQYIIPGTGNFNLTEKSFGCDEEFYRKRLLASDFEIDYDQMNFNADYTHILWRHTKADQRSLVPRDGTKIAILDVDFDGVKLEDLMSPQNMAKYSTNEIVANDDPKNPGTTLLKPGTIIGIQTPDNGYFVLRVDEHLTLKRRRWKYVPGIHTQRPNYNLLCTIKDV